MSVFFQTSTWTRTNLFDGSQAVSRDNRVAESVAKSDADLMCVFEGGGGHDVGCFGESRDGAMMKCTRIQTGSEVMRELPR
jgi:hypothetical protein